MIMDFFLAMFQVCINFKSTNYQFIANKDKGTLTLRKYFTLQNLMTELGSSCILISVPLQNSMIDLDSSCILILPPLPQVQLVSSDTLNSGKLPVNVGASHFPRNCHVQTHNLPYTSQAPYTGVL